MNFMHGAVVMSLFGKISLPLSLQCGRCAQIGGWLPAQHCSTAFSQHSRCLLGRASWQPLSWVTYPQKGRLNRHSAGGELQCYFSQPISAKVGAQGRCASYQLCLLIAAYSTQNERVVHDDTGVEGCVECCTGY